MTNDLTSPGGGIGRVCLKPVLAIAGHFRVPGYQRGYRWGQLEVERLVGDIHANLGRNYCLQPIVVKGRESGWELVDGQQRLTTLYLLVRALGGTPGWTLHFETRPDSAHFLAHPDAKGARVNIDFHHIWQAEQAIQASLAGLDPSDPEARAALLKSLSSTVQIIWYEAPGQVDSVDLFTRLNSGRIPLDDAELFKALLLSQSLTDSADDTEEGSRLHHLRTNELAVQWDTIERDLRRAEIWAFVAGNRSCPTHISLLLEIVAGVAPDDAAGTFRVFEALSARGAATVWRDVVQLHERLLGWNADRLLYHRIGFLIAQASAHGRYSILRGVVAAATERRHSEFGQWLEDQVREKLQVNRLELSDLRYDRDHARIQRLLLLMNIETASRNSHAEARYPFAAHHKELWELEHIHAQNAPELNTAGQWQAWIDAHHQAVQALPESDALEALLQKIARWHEASAAEAPLREAFRELASEILAFLAGGEAGGSEDEVHRLENLALLAKEDNIRLGNSAFEVKRQKIIAYDRAGRFIPACTRHVFLKYYSAADAVQPHFWSATDRKGYFSEIETVLGHYLGEEPKP